MARFKVTCPCCQALLELDDEKQVVVEATPVEKPRSTTSFEERLTTLAREKEDAKAKLAEAMRAEQAGSEIREERFKRLLEDAQSRPDEKPPLRDIGLD
jgi:uncharacterized Zn finger protein (UPF0148 family)